MEKFIHNDKEYTYIPYEELKDEDLPKGKYNDEKIYAEFPEEYWMEQSHKSHHKKYNYVNLGCGFDIETSVIRDTKRSTMYVWQFSIDDITIIGRTWEEFKELLARLKKVYYLQDNRRMLVWIHNEKFEFSFIKSQLEWNEKIIKKDGIIVDKRPDIFALDNREVIKACTKDFVEFRDSLIVTQLPLEKLAKNYGLGIEKLKGDLDYTLPRHSKTPLTNEELAYCINDVQILQRFYHEYIRKEYIKKGKPIPLTMTSIVNNELREEFEGLPKEVKKTFKKILKEGFLDEETNGILMEGVYRGGYNHGNALYSNITLINRDMGSEDFKSSYPAVMLHEKFPYKFTETNPNMFYEIGDDKKYLKDNAYFGLFKVHNIDTRFANSLESKNKLVDYSEDAMFDNGRLVSASEVKVWLCEQDVLNYIDIYTVEKYDFECLCLYTAKKDYLPKYLRDLVLKYFYLKETLEKDTIEYNIAKAKLNSFYGLCVKALQFEDLRFNIETMQFDDGNLKKSYAEAIKNAILLPQWGVWVSAYARRNLVHTMSKLENDFVYGDTDSAKVVNFTANKWVFDSYNDRMRRLNETMYVGNYDRKIFAKIGMFDFEGKIFKFKELGCKRYLTTQIVYNKEENLYNLKHKSTVAGMKKGSLQNYCKANDLDIYEEFNPELKIGTDFSEKLTTHFEDKPFEDYLTDYLGVTEGVHEKSCCTLVPIPFKFKDMSTYIAFFTKVQKQEEIRGRIYG